MKQCLLAIVICFLFFGCSSNSIDKANQLIELGSYDEAISLLAKEIQNNPKDKAAHLALGNAYASRYAKGRDYDSREKAVQYYKSSLLIDPDYAEALHNLSDFYLFIGNTKDAAAGFNALSEKSEAYPVSNIFHPDQNSVNEFLKQYNDGITGNQSFIIVPQQNYGTVIITEDCEGGIDPVFEGISRVTLKQYDVFDGAQSDESGVVTPYQTYVELGDKETLYKVDLYELVNYTSGQKFRKYGEKELKYTGRLYKRLLTDNEQRVLSSMPEFNGSGSQMAVGNIYMLFTGNHQFGSFGFSKHPEYRISQELPYVPSSDYREIVEIGEPKPFKVKRLGFHQNTGKMVFQEVTARRYLGSVPRTCRIPAGKFIYGSGNVSDDKRVIDQLNEMNVFKDSDKLLYMSGKVYKGTMKRMIDLLFGRYLVLDKKYYVDGNSFEYWRNKSTEKELVFVNGVLEDVAE